MNIFHLPSSYSKLNGEESEDLLLSMGDDDTFLSPTKIQTRSANVTNAIHSPQVLNNASNCKELDYTPSADDKIRASEEEEEHDEDEDETVDFYHSVDELQFVQNQNMETSFSRQLPKHNSSTFSSKF